MTSIGEIWIFRHTNTYKIIKWRKGLVWWKCELLKTKLWVWCQSHYADWYCSGYLQSRWDKLTSWNTGLVTREQNAILNLELKDNKSTVSRKIIFLKTLLVYLVIFSFLPIIIHFSPVIVSLFWCRGLLLVMWLF